MSAVCPSCGVAVVPGYQRCPKCRAALPYGTGRIKRVTSDPGGTTVRESGFPIMAALIGAIAIALAVVLIFGLGGKDKKKPKRAVPVTQEPMARVPSAPVPTAPVEAAPPSRCQPRTPTRPRRASNARSSASACGRPSRPTGHASTSDRPRAASPG